MNHQDIIDLLAAIAAVDKRTIGQADVIVWHDLIGDLPRDLALRAAREHFRECPGTYLEPGHIYQRVRAIRRDIVEREHARRLNAENDAKMALIAAELAERKAIPGEEPQQRRRATPRWLQVKCPWCGQRAGERCIVPGTRAKLTQTLAHPSRLEAVAGHEHHAAFPICTACGTNPLVTDEHRGHGVCTPCRQAATPQQPKTEVPERNNA